MDVTAFKSVFGLVLLSVGWRVTLALPAHPSECLATLIVMPLQVLGLQSGKGRWMFLWASEGRPRGCTTATVPAKPYG